MSEISAGKRRLTVNAAFLKDIKDDNRDLKILTDRLRAVTKPRPTAANHWAELIRLLADLRDQLAIHFGLEEAYGYFDMAMDADAQLSAAAETLRAEHAELFETCRHLADSTAGVVTPEVAGEDSVEGRDPELTTAQEKVLDRIERFLFQFHRHEESELKLILDALDEDLGGGD